MAASLPIFPPFSVHENAPDVRWKKWVKRLDNLLIGMDIRDTKRRRALLLHYAGEEVNDIFETLQETGEDYPTAVEKLTNYFSPKKNNEFEIYKFRQEKQQNGQSIDDFHTKLRQLSATCEFSDVDKEIKSQIIQGCLSTRLRRRALREEMDLTHLLTLARAMELSDRQATEIEKSERENANAIMKRRTPSHRRNKRHFMETAKGTNKQQYKNQTCRNCGGEYPHKDRQCPAKGRQCNFCKKKNHFAKVCRSRLKTESKVNQVESQQDRSSTSENSDEEYTFGLRTRDKVNSLKPKQPHTMVEVDGTKIEVLIDTGSSINVMDEHTFAKLKPKPKLQKTDTNVFAYGSETKLHIVGKFQANIETKYRITTALFYVTKGNFGNLLSYETSIQLQIIPRICATGKSKSEELCKMYPDIFKGIGKLKDVKIHLHTDDTVIPVTQPHRRIPFHIRKKVEKELARLEELDIIEKVDGPTPWVSPIVVAPKPKNPDEIRICVDMRLPNEAVLRQRHITPTIDDLIADLNGATIFSKLDLNSGYHQLELDEKSRNITTFSTHIGLRRYKRLIFGISSAAEIFQNTLCTTLEGLKGTRNISDDILVFGRTQEEHDENLEATFTRIQQKGLTLNKHKCEFNKDKIEFFGYIFSKDGISPDPKKVEAIKSASTPSNISEVRSFLGMTNYVGRFIPNYATINEPLRALTKQNQPWEWTEKHEKAFDKLKQELASSTIIAYFDPNKETQLIVDASPVGLGALLTQNGKVIAYASRALSDVEKRYSQTEREALAIVWSCEHFHLYLFGHTFKLISDHKPLEVIFNNPKSRPPARIERWRLRLQAYNFKVVYKPGKTNAADYISRHPKTGTECCKHSEVAEAYVQFIFVNAIPKAMTIEEIRTATLVDQDLQQVIKLIKSGNWKQSYKQNKTLETFSRLRHELTIVPVTNGFVLLCDKKLVIPKGLRNRVIELAHEGHQGIVKTKQLLREKVWFPGIDKQVEDFCQSCIPCLASTPKQTTEPLQMTVLPNNPWSQISMDFNGPLPSGVYLMVLVDDYSRYPVVEIINSTSAKTVIPQLDKIFSMFGIPEVVKTDNGPPFNGYEFTKFAEYMGFKHRKITPLWPQANGEAERFMRTIGKIIKAANAERKSWKQEIYTFLRNYRATPHATTNKSPAEILFGRKMRTKLPSIQIKPDDNKTRKTDTEKKAKMKKFADQTRKAKKSNFKVGDSVLVKQETRDKLSTPFDPKPYEVINKKGSMITARREDHQITRNSSFFKTVKNSPHIPPSDDQTDDTINLEKDGDRCDTYPSSDLALRRSSRIRKPPDYLKDYV